MSDFFFRTEDIKPEDVGTYFVESKKDREIVDALKSKNPTVLIGSRGVGKSFLLRVAQKELNDTFPVQRVYPVYLSFVKSSLIQSTDPDRFKNWMLSRIASTILRSLLKSGLIAKTSLSARQLAGGEVTESQPTKLETAAEAYENSWKNPSAPVDGSKIPVVDDLKEALEEIASEANIERFALFIDEAAHIFVPEQQRQFFTLFRDLRSHCITCNAAVYPGVTSFGDTFQPAHDATMIAVDRDILSSEYVENMREIVQKQSVDSTLLRNIAKNIGNFSILAYAASGNPRLLLKTLSATPKVNSSQTNEVIREFYRTDIWSEHSTLADKYSGHRAVIDWGRQFCENQVFPELKLKNDQYLSVDKNTSAYIWIHRDAPATIKEALRVLSYTGILSEQAAGIKASRGEIGTRYVVNLGCLFSLEATPSATSLEIAKGLTPKRMTEYGANHSSYKPLIELAGTFSGAENGHALKIQLDKSIEVLDLSGWQRSKLLELGLQSVGDILTATEDKLKEAYYVGDIRARRMRNAAIAAVLEYLSG